MNRGDYERKLEQALNNALATTPEPVDTSPQRGRRKTPIGIIAATLGALVVSAYLAYFSIREPAPLDDCNALTIAIMPFQNLSGDPQQDYLAAGLAQQVWQLLADIDGIGMISMASSARLAESNVDLSEIGDLLGATYVVEGSYVSGDGPTRVYVSLTDSDTVLEIWSDQFDAAIDSTKAAFELYASIATALTDSLPAAIGRQEWERARKRFPEESLEVWQLIQQAAYQKQQTGGSGAMVSIDKALQLDPDSSLALTSKALYLANGLSKRPQLNEAESLARRAISLDDNSQAYAVLGYVFLHRDKDLSAAIDSFRKALLLGESANLLGFMALEFFEPAGEWAAGLEAAERSLRLEPENATLLFYKARFLSGLGRTAEATAVYDYALERYPGNGDLVFTGFHHYLAAGELGRAEQTASLGQPNPTWPKMVSAYLAAERGDPQPLLERIEDWKSRTPPAARNIAPAYFQLRHFGEHLEWAASEPEAIWPLNDSRLIPSYWDKLESWAEGNAVRSEKLTLFREHLETQEAGLSFPIPPMHFVDEIYAQSFHCAG
jgi:TolB-like protein/Tfp pilus assembly protein PilF